MAGESARKKAERLTRSAEYYRRGSEGEEATATALTGLAPTSWAVIHDVAWPGRKLANIDHVVVGPSGVFVIDSKNWSGQIVVEGGVLRQNRRARVSTVKGAEAARAAVAALLPQLRPDYVHAVVCFSGEVADGHADDVLICSTGTLLTLLTTGPAVLSDESVRAVADSLRSLLPSATEPRPTPISKFTLSDRITMATPRTKPRSQKRRSPRIAVSVVAGLALAVGLATNPGAFLAVSNGVAELITDQMKAPANEPVQPDDKKVDKKHKAPTKKKNKNKQDGQSQR